MQDDVKSIIDKIEANKQKKQDFWAKNEELKVEYQKALQGLAKDVNGEHFLKTLVSYTGLFDVKESPNHAEMLIKRGKKQVYLELIRPFLTKEQRKEIENE